MSSAPNPYEVAYPVEENPRKNRVPRLALFIMLVGTVVCFTGIWVAYTAKQRARAADVQKMLEVEQARSQANQAEQANRESQAE